MAKVETKKPAAAKRRSPVALTGRVPQHAKALKALRESEARFRNLTALSSDWYWEQDSEFRLTFMSSGLAERTGLSVQAYLGKRRWEQPTLNLNEEDWARHRAQLERHEPFKDFEMQRQSDDGGTVWLSITGEPVFDRAGRFAGYRGIGRDITARKREERLLALEHAVVRCLAEADGAADGITRVIRAVCEAQDWECGRYFAWSEGAGALTFAQSWNLPRPELDDFIRCSRERSYAPGTGLIGEVYRCGQPLWVSDVTTDERVRTGMAADAGMRGAFLFPAMSEGRALGVLVFHSRVIRAPEERVLQAVRVIGSQIGQFLQGKEAERQRRKVETQFRQTFELAGSGICHVDLDGRFLRVNRKVTEILGYEAQELVGVSVKDISHPEDRDVTDARRARLKVGEIDALHTEKRYVRKDGRVVWVDLTVALARDEAGKPHYEISVLEDITDRKRAEQLQGLEHKATRCLADASSVVQALRDVMQAICQSERWDAARYFELDAADGVMRFRESWCVDDPQARRFVDGARNVVYRRGEGLVGAAWADNQPLWVSDLASEPRVSHPALAAQTGMRGAFNFPVTFDGTAIGMISITSHEVREPDRPLLQTLRVIGSQIGQFLLRKRSEEAQQRFRAALDASADMVFLVDMRNVRILDFNATACRYLGYAREELLGCSPDRYLNTSKEELAQGYEKLLERVGRADAVQRTYRRKDGTTFEAEVLRRVVDSPQGPILVVNARDLTERLAAGERHKAYLRYQENIARLGQSALGMRQAAELIADAAQCVLHALDATAVAYVEPCAGGQAVVVRDVVGVAKDPAAQTAPHDAGGTLAEVLQGAQTRLLDGAAAPLPFAWSAGMRSAALLPVGAERPARGALCVLSQREHAFGPQEVRFIEAAASVLSAGLQRIDSESRLSYLAQFDGLTGLPNRALLNDRFDQMIAQARRHGASIGVLFVDLDEFKLVNDTLGHAAGDELLKEAAGRLQACVRPGDTVARISGDEFAVILADLAHAEDAAMVAQKIIEQLCAPVEIQGREVVVTASIGIASFPGDGEDAEALVGAADAAMYRAKQSGRNAYQFFTAEINQKSRARAKLAAELRRALEREEFALVYQPKFDLATGAACGAEALLRWRHPERGIVMPDEFIPVLEETGLIVRVGEWVLERACAEINAWAAKGLQALPVAVNLSARQFRQPDLDLRICDVVGRAQIDPALIELEITESRLMQDPDHTIRVMNALRRAGIRTAIDDFGTGYSSLAYLSRFPVSSLKIDRSFVAEVNDDANAATIVRTIVEMAHSLGFTVVAEGVETDDQKAFLRRVGCEQAQGFLLARPMQPAEFAALLSARRERGSSVNKVTFRARLAP